MTDEANNPSIAASSQDLINKGWQAHVKKEYDAAEKFFERALAVEAKNIEAYYGIGLVKKALARTEEAIAAFTKVIELIDDQVNEQTRAEMLRRLSQGHINRLVSGDWGLEGEIWQRK